MVEKTRTQDISIYNEDGSYNADVDSNLDLHTKSKLWDGTNQVGVVAGTPNRLAVDANISAPSGGFITAWQKLVSDGKGFRLTTDFINISGTLETPFVYFNNPVGSGKTAKIKILQTGMDVANYGQRHFWHIYRDPTITANGTALAITKILKTGNNATVISAYLSPTVTALGTLLIVGITTDVEQIYDFDLTLVIQPGEKMLINLEPSTNNRDHLIDLAWAEE